jgi:3-deoxy-7-phosphoheptulonate synthase
MKNATSDVRIDSIVTMQSPAELSARLPLPENLANAVAATRQRIADIIHGRDSRLLVVVGPCSIHDTAAAMDYANRLLELRNRFKDVLEIVMRVYFEKPRTIIGWKGLINDPHMDSSFHIDEGLYTARKLLIDLAAIGMPAGCEFLDAATGQYYADTVSWGAIGARTTESQVHREIASGLSCPVGFKNATSGDIGIAIDAIQAAGHPHAFLSPTDEGRIALYKTKGNEDAHLILRGGSAPNYDSASVMAAHEKQSASGITRRILIDCSHANSQKDHLRQMLVASDIAHRLPAEAPLIAGLMLESHLVEGNQAMNTPDALTYGQSITDACMGWEDTAYTLAELAESMSAPAR